MISHFTKASIASFHSFNRQINSTAPAHLSYIYQPCIETSLKNIPNLVVLHGVLGSSKNFRGITHNPKIASKVNTHLLDLRNHGKSDHRESMTYPEMAEDVYNYFLQHDLMDDENIVLGHSMGGRVAMEFAARHPDLVKGVSVVDLAPYNYFEDSRFSFIEVMDSMLERLVQIDLKDKNLSELRKEVIKASMDKETGEVISTNLVPDEHGGYKWRINMEGIYRHFKTEIMDLEYIGTRKFEGPTQIICGAQSDYMSRDIVHSYKKIFANIDLEKDIHFLENAGHWVHYSQPHQFINLVSEFIDRVCPPIMNEGEEDRYQFSIPAHHYL